MSRKDWDVRGNISDAKTLPRRVFTDPSVHSNLLNTWYRTEWLTLPLHHYLKRETRDAKAVWEGLEVPGASERIEYLGEPLLLKRDTKPETNPALHCVLGVCPHNGGSLQDEETDTRHLPFFKCPFHGLITDCAGSFKAFPGLQNPTLEQRKALSLKQYHIQVWRDFLFLCRGNPIAPWNAVFDPLTQIVSRMPLEQLRYTPHAKEVRRVPINPLLQADNHCDWLHIQGGVHGGEEGLEGAIKMKKYRWKPFDHMLLQWAYAVNSEDGFDPQCLPKWLLDDEDPTSRVYAVWLFQPPNVAWNFYNWGLSLNVYNPVPGNPEETEFLWTHYVWDQKEYAKAQGMLYRVDEEDISELTQVQKNMKVDPNHRGVFGPTNEMGRYWLHRRVSQMMLAQSKS